MENRDLGRREFTKLTAAAFGGMVAGAGMAWADKKEGADSKDDGKNPLLSEPHVCRGLNTCKNKGGCGASKGKNECAGQGNCATAKAHECSGHNECKGQGGCGAKPGENACKGKGECAVPLKDAAWKKARARFEELMKKEGKKVGPAPKKA